MPVPPPIHDPSHIEQRLLILAEILDRAVREVYHVMDEIRGVYPATSVDHPAEQEGHP